MTTYSNPTYCENKIPGIADILNIPTIDMTSPDNISFYEKCDPLFGKLAMPNYKICK